jgi:hypothetical protein
MLPVGRTSSRLRTIDLVGAAFEGRGKAPEGGVEDAPHQEAERTVAEFVGEKKLNIAGRGAGRPKGPAVIHPPKRAFEIFDKDRQLGAIERDAAGEGLADKLVRNRHVGDDHLPAPTLLSALAHHQRFAQRHEFRIALYVGDEVEHVGRGVLHSPVGGELRH